MTLSFEMSAEQVLLVDAARRIGQSYGLDYWHGLDQEQVPPLEYWQAICDAGLAGVALPESSGGAGLGMLELVLIIEALCETGAGIALAQMFMMNAALGGQAIAQYGSDDMRRELLPKLLNGAEIMSFAMTEPSAGSNALDIRTYARAHESGWLLRGQKVWITLASEARWMLVIARTTPVDQVARKTDGLSMFLLDGQREGIRRQKISKTGTRPLPAYEVFFDDVVVRHDELIGTLDGAWPELTAILNGERMVTAAGLVGTGRIAVKLACDYATERKVYKNTPIASYQAIQFPLAQAHAQLEAARWMNRQAAWLMDRQRPFASAANVAKLLAADAACFATDRAVQTLGGMGFASEFHVERLWRDARLFAVAPIPQEMILNFIAVHDLGLPRSY
ncbi:acyl-CoA dehydrogenase family protein [Castellaniella sp.]|uniref:acyl-CoA dehydrogenase family protein n=1 Tax=Castellaniella sp. TaxID=1955812 RepID=UPI0035667EF1